MHRDWSGVGTALVTPFLASGAIDEKTLKALITRNGGEVVQIP